MNNVTVSCAEIQTPVGFVYVILSVLLNHTDDPDCEHWWYSQDRRLIADPSDPQRLIYPVISVSSDRLVTSQCVNLNHEIICDSADGSHFRLETVFRVRNETAVTPDSVTPDLKHSDQWWLFALFFIIIIIILICFSLRKRIFRCVLRAETSVCQINDSVNRDPKSGVQMKFRSDDPCSLNESESEQLDGFMFRG